MNGRATTLPAVSLFPTPQEAADRLGELFPTAYLALHRRDGKRSELTGASRAVLQHLARSGPLTIGEAANHLARAQSVVSDIVTQLEGHGLVERQRDPADHRRVLVWLTDDGLEAVRYDASVLSHDRLADAIARVDPAGVASAVDVLRRLAHEARPNTDHPTRRSQQ